MTTPHVSRRRFLQNSSAAALVAGTGFHSQLLAADSKSPNELLNIGCVGVANRASANLKGVSSENIVGICDIDDKYLDAVADIHPKASRYNDFRKMLDKPHTIDAVVVSTPDHTHAPAAIWAMQLGKHVYCEKPMTHTVHEAREMTKLATSAKLTTQLGTQIHAKDNYRRVVELVQSGAIGDIDKVDVWVGKGWGGGTLPKEKPEVPANIHWDVWLGPAPYRPYHSIYLPANWRRWWDFGGGTLADMGCHYIDLVFWSLKLKYPEKVRAEGPPVDPQTAPLGLTVTWQFPQTTAHQAVEMTWRDGNHSPREVAGHSVPGSGVMFHGSEGKLLATYDNYKLFPEEKFADFTPPEQSIPSSVGHHQEWIQGCKEGTPTLCSFDYSGPLTETVLLGNVAYRSGQEIHWDAKSLQVTNSDAANGLIQREYRPGWRLG